MNRLACFAIPAALVAMPTLAQTMDPSMPRMDMGSHIAPQPSAPAPAPRNGQAQGAAGTDQPPGSAEPPPVVHDRAADRYFDPQAMAAAQMAMMAPAPGVSQVRLDLAEYDFRNGHDGYQWEGEAWTGDRDRLVLRSKGEGSVGAGLDSAELQGLYSHALDPWWNLQLGVRQDIRPTPVRSYATVAIEGLAPYKIDVLVAAFLSDKGQWTARIETTVDERLTRRFVLQPRIELDAAAQNMPAQRLGAGLNKAEFGLRLRYEITRQIAPYFGFSANRATGKTADYMRAAGNAAYSRSVVIGMRSWF